MIQAPPAVAGGRLGGLLLGLGGRLRRQCRRESLRGRIVADALLDVDRGLLVCRPLVRGCRHLQQLMDALSHLGVDLHLPTCPEDEWREMCDLTAQTADGLRLPPNWRRVSAREGEPINYLRQDGLSVLVSAGRFDGRLWQHTSLAYRNRMPVYQDLADVKALFIGKGLQAIQVFPPQSRHVNIHSFCLHLWACLEPDGDGLPDFGAHGTI